MHGWLKVFPHFRDVNDRFGLNFERVGIIDFRCGSWHTLCFTEGSVIYSCHALDKNSAQHQPNQIRLRKDTEIDLSQALLCLITFSAPTPQTPGAAACPVVEQAEEVQRKVDLDVHLMNIEKDGSEIASSAGAHFLEDTN